ncbi:MAG: hypothetical protein FWF72_05020 [Paludibacter sp.]|nr:hypothetical protein [Paludibacter sp.]
MRNKNLIIKIFIIAAVIIAVGYLLAAFVFFSENKNNDVCKSVNVSILNYDKIKMLDSKTIEDFIKKSKLNPVGKSVTKLKIETLENELLNKNPTIKSVECYLTTSGVMNVDVKQRTPKFRVMTNSESYYVDSERKIFPVSINFSAYVPVASGVITATFAKGELFDFISFIEKDKFWNAQIEQIYVVDNKQIELVPRVGSGIIIFGDLTNIEKKFDKLKTLYSEGFSQIGWNRYKTIDVSLKTDQIVCTKIDR